MWICLGYYPKFIADRLAAVPGLLPVREEDQGAKAGVEPTRLESYVQPMRYGVIPSGWDATDQDHHYERYGLLTPVLDRLIIQFIIYFVGLKYIIF